MTLEGVEKRKKAHCHALPCHDRRKKGKRLVKVTDESEECNYWKNSSTDILARVTELLQVRDHVGAARLTNVYEL